MKRSYGGLVVGTLLTLGALLAARPAVAAIIPTVGTDDNTFNGNCTLREAIRSINENWKVDACGWSAGETTVHLTARTYSISTALGGISVTAKTITVAGLGHRVSIVDLAGGGGEAFVIAPSADAGAQTFTDFTVRNSISTAFRTGTNTKARLNRIKIENMGALEGGRGCIRVMAGQLTLNDGQIKKCGGTGVSIANLAAFTLTRSTITESNGERGGAIQNEGALWVNRSTLGANTASVYGAAVLNNSTGSAMITGSTIVHNRTGGTSGALHNSGLMTIESSVLAHNVTTENGAPANCKASPTIISNGYNTLGDQPAKTCTGNGATDVVADPKLLKGTSNLPYAAGGVGAVYPPSSTSPLSRIPATNQHCRIPDQRGIIRSRLPTCDAGAVERFSALFITSAAGSNCDLIVPIMLTMSGGNVTQVSDTTADSQLAGNKTLVVISESVTSTTLNTKFRDVQVPILNMEPLLVDDLRMTGPTNETHYGVITASAITMNGVRGTVNELPHRFGMLQGSITVVSGAQAFGWTKAPTGAAPIVSGVSTADFLKDTIMVYPGRDLTMYNGFKSPQARVSFFPMAGACASLNADGQALMTEALVYAASF